MTSRERVLTAFERKPTDKAPIHKIFITSDFSARP
jgi:hypothetical protein